MTDLIEQTLVTGEYKYPAEFGWNCLYLEVGF